MPYCDAEVTSFSTPLAIPPVGVASRNVVVSLSTMSASDPCATGGVVNEARFGLPGFDGTEREQTMECFGAMGHVLASMKTGFVERADTSFKTAAGATLSSLSCCDPRAVIKSLPTAEWQRGERISSTDYEHMNTIAGAGSERCCSMTTDSATRHTRFAAARSERAWSFKPTSIWNAHERAWSSANFSFTTTAEGATLIKRSSSYGSQSSLQGI